MLENSFTGKCVEKIRKNISSDQLLNSSKTFQVIQPACDGQAQDSAISAWVAGTDPATPALIDSGTPFKVLDLSGCKQIFGYFPFMKRFSGILSLILPADFRGQLPSVSLIAACLAGQDQAGQQMPVPRP
jgi:hypothetical protein